MARLKDRSDNHVAQKQKGGGLWDYEERDLSQSRVEPPAQHPADFILRSRRSGTSWAIVAATDIPNRLTGSRNRIWPIVQRRHCPRRQQAGQQVVDVGADLHDAASGHDRKEVVEHCFEGFERAGEIDS